MTLIKIDPNSATHWLPTELWGRTSVPVGMIVPALMTLPCTCTFESLELHPCKCHTLEAVRINDLSPMAPWSHFRAHMLKQAARFVKYAARQSLAFQPLTAEADMRVYGPYRTRIYEDPEKKVAHGRKRGENPDRAMVDFKIWGEFVQKYARVTDDGPARKDWAVQHWAEVDRDIAERAAQQPQIILATR